MKIERVRTGIAGLDPLIGGGLPSNSVVLVSGAAGTGKTVMSLQYLANGAKRGHRGLYVSFEEREEKIAEQARQFGWDLEGLQKKGMLKILCISKLTLGQILSELSSTIKKFKPDRLVIDSITYLVLSAHAYNRLVDLDKVPVDELIYGSQRSKGGEADLDGIVVRKIMVDLVKMLEAKNICTLLISEVSKSSEWYSRDTLSEFACDGIILLRATSLGSDLQRSIEVIKMRNTNVKGGVYGFEFRKDGIRISP